MKKNGSNDSLSAPFGRSAEETLSNIKLLINVLGNVQEEIGGDIAKAQKVILKKISSIERQMKVNMFVYTIWKGYRYGLIIEHGVAHTHARLNEEEFRELIERHPNWLFVDLLQYD
jgi:hypothetical protein